jgi:ornithine carrier protein
MAEVASSALWRLIEDSHFWKSIEPTLERVVLDPKYHDALTLVKGMRNGIVYGTKVRFPHALVYVF